MVLGRGSQAFDERAARRFVEPAHVATTLDSSPFDLLPWVTLQGKDRDVKSDFDKQWEAGARRTAEGIGQALIPPGTRLTRMYMRRKKLRIGRLTLYRWKRIV